MKSARNIFIAFVIALVLSIAFKSYSQETKQDTKPDAAGVAIQETTPALAAEGKTDEKDAGHDHVMGTEKRFVATVGVDGVQHVEVIGGDYYFDPNYIVVKVNVPVELKVKKASGYIPHDIAVKAPEAGIDFKKDLDKDWQAITFTPTKVGKYEMICDKRLLWFKSHKDRGMYGFIEVVP
jgi:plastocyanin